LPLTCEPEDGKEPLQLTYQRLTRDIEYGTNTALVEL
jgi:hypothetical protein